MWTDDSSSLYSKWFTTRRVGVSWRICRMRLLLSSHFFSLFDMKFRIFAPTRLSQRYFSVEKIIISFREFTSFSSFGRPIRSNWRARPRLINISLKTFEYQLWFNADVVHSQLQFDYTIMLTNTHVHSLRTRSEMDFRSDDEKSAGKK